MNSSAGSVCPTAQSLTIKRYVSIIIASLIIAEIKNNFTISNDWKLKIINYIEILYYGSYDDCTGLVFMVILLNVIKVVINVYCSY